MTREEAITVMQLYKDELEHRIAIAKIDYDPGAIDLYSIQLDAFDVAIEALSAEVVHKPDYSYEADMVRRLKEALSADAVQEWIPVSERLPSESGWYIVTVCGYERIVDVLPYNSGWNGVTTKQEVVAWMPLPMPYRKEDEDDGKRNDIHYGP